jgi:hypothetical protein
MALAGILGSSSAWSQTTGGPTRAEYIAQADPICKAVFSKPLPHKGRTANQRAANGFAAVARHIRKMANQLDSIPKPAADSVQLNSWIAALRRFSARSAQLSKALRGGKQKRIHRALGRLNKAQKQRLTASRGYGFNVCR